MTGGQKNSKNFALQLVDLGVYELLAVTQRSGTARNSGFRTPGVQTVERFPVVTFRVEKRDLFHGLTLLFTGVIPASVRAPQRLRSMPSP